MTAHREVPLTVDSTLGKMLALRPVSYEESLWRVAVFALVWVGEFTFDLRQPVNAETLLRRTAGVLA